MQHGGPCWVIRLDRVFPRALATLIAASACSGETRAVQSTSPVESVLDPYELPGSAPAPAEMPPAARPAEPPVEPPPGFVSLDACSASLAACQNGSTAPCTLHCATRADGCEVSSEFVPLGTLDSNYYFRFGAIDPAGEWVLY